MNEFENSNQRESASSGKSWISISILVLIIALGAVLRLDNITRQNLWRDEYWTLCLATGRGPSLVHLPRNEIIVHPPDAGFADAPGWWHIWNGIQTTSHPPLYHIILRFWVDLLGDSDFSVRGMSTFFSLGCIALMFVAVRLWGGGDREALIAAALMALAPVQIYYSQQVRPYTMMQFIAIMVAIVVISVEQRGGSWMKVVGIGAGAAALAMTHYFSVGFIAALAVYALVRFRGSTRAAMFGAVVAGAAIAAIAWAPHLRDYPLTDYGRIPGRNLIHLVLSVPQRLTMETDHDPLVMADNGSWALVISIALLVYVFPVVLRRQRKELLLWWLWVVFSIGLVFAIDLLRHSTLLTFTRYVILAAPAVYAILAVPLPGRIGRITPWVFLVGMMIYAADYCQAGPPNAPDFEIVSRCIKQEVKPGDVVIITGSYYLAGDDEPPMTYFALAHYGGPWKTPIVFGTAAFSEKVQRQLIHYHRIWVVGISPDTDTRKILPGWNVKDVHGAGNSNLLWYVTPGTTGDL